MQLLHLLLKTVTSFAHFSGNRKIEIIFYLIAGQAKTAEAAKELKSDGQAADGLAGSGASPNNQASGNYEDCCRGK